MTADAARKPDELWVSQINPQARDGEPPCTGDDGTNTVTECLERLEPGDTSNQTRSR